MQAYLDALANGSPTPGGGSAAAITGSMAAALVVMVCRTTLGKERFQAVEEEMLSAQDEADGWKTRLMSLAAQDEAAYQGVVNAYRLPKVSDSERALRSQAIQSALRRATEVPLETAQACGTVLHLAGRIVGKINPNALSDLGTSAALAEAGLRGALLNVLTNAVGIDDGEFSQDAVSQVTTLSSAAVELREAVYAYCTQRFV